MSTGAAALLATITAILGWHGARFHRARKDVADAKAKVPQAKRVMGIERKPVLIIAAIAFILIWWWLHKHSG